MGVFNAESNIILQTYIDVKELEWIAILVWCTSISHIHQRVLAVTLEVKSFWVQGVVMRITPGTTAVWTALDVTLPTTSLTLALFAATENFFKSQTCKFE